MVLPGGRSGSTSPFSGGTVTTTERGVEVAGVVALASVAPGLESAIGTGAVDWASTGDAKHAAAKMQKMARRY